MASKIKVHKAAEHGIGTTCYYCDEAGCEHRAKVASSIKRHKADAHGIGATWFYCDEAGCEHRAKVAGSIGSSWNRNDLVLLRQSRLRTSSEGGGQDQGAQGG